MANKKADFLGQQVPIRNLSLFKYMINNAGMIVIYIVFYVYTVYFYLPIRISPEAK